MLNFASAELGDRLESECDGTEVPKALIGETPVEGGEGPVEMAKSYILYRLRRCVE